MRSWTRNVRVPVVCALALAAAIVVGALAPAEARPKPRAPTAPASVDAELVTLHATQGTKGGQQGFDPRIGRPPALTRPPFSAYNTFKLLKRSGAILAKGMSWKTKLPNGLDLLVALEAVVMPKQAGDPIRYVIKASVARAGTTSFEQLVQTETVAGEMIFVQARKHQKGIVVVGIKLLAAAPAPAAAPPRAQARR
jgi:hypothetical protein